MIDDNVDVVFILFATFFFGGSFVFLFIAGFDLSIGNVVIIGFAAIFFVGFIIGVVLLIRVWAITEFAVRGGETVNEVF